MPRDQLPGGEKKAAPECGQSSVTAMLIYFAFFTAAFLATGFFAVVFFAATTFFAAGFFAQAFFAAGFFAATFFAAGFAAFLVTGIVSSFVQKFDCPGVKHKMLDN